MKNFEEYIKTYVDSRVQPNNIIEATIVSTTLRKAAGVAVLVQGFNKFGKVKTKFSFMGLFFFIFWSSVYFYCGYVAVAEKQTILRKLYDTKLKGYGDTVEWTIATVYVVYCLWKIPFSISGNVIYIQAIVDIDNVIREIKENVDYIKCSMVSILTTMGQIVAGACHIFSLWVTQSSMSGRMPYALMYQVVLTNVMAMSTTAHYCFYLFLLRMRFLKVNDIIRNLASAEYSGSSVKAITLRDKSLCETLRTCSRIYAMIFQAVRAANKVFGLAIAMSMGTSFFSIILNLFYLMEATAGQLFKEDVERYTYFLVYIFWEILYAFLIILLNILVCEKTKNAVCGFELFSSLYFSFDRKNNTELV